MVQYLLELLKDLEKVLNTTSGAISGPLKYKQLLEVVAEELNRLDPLDFPPDSRLEFVRLRKFLQYLASQNLITGSPWRKPASDLIIVLQTYGGQGSRSFSKNFSFVADAQLRTIIDRDYRELSMILLPSGAWKSTVVLSGSILEALLQDALTKDSAILSKAETSSKAPVHKTLEKGEWKLHDLIEVAVDLQILPLDRSKAIDQILRDYRNYVHPKKEIRSKYPCTEAEALLSKGALDAVINILSP